MPTVRSVQYLRAVAALMVLMFHALTRVKIGFVIGNAGVDIFFVISGFIMWKVSKRESSPGLFLSRRLMRIAPLYWGVTTLTAACAILLPGKIFPNMTVSLSAFLQSLLFVPHYDATGHLYPVVVPGWTLTYEMAFYVLFALCLLAPRTWRLWLLTAALVIAVATGKLMTSTSPLFLTYTAPLILEFAAGCWLARALEAEIVLPPLASAGLLAAGVAALAVQAVLGQSVGPELRPLFWGLPALAIVGGAVMLEARVTPPDLPLLKAMGDASYSIYLLHGFVISACFKLLHNAPTVVYLASTIIGACLVGYLSYRLFERPVGDGLKRLSSRRTAEVPA